jgi:hypothetical protein
MCAPFFSRRDEWRRRDFSRARALVFCPYKFTKMEFKPTQEAIQLLIQENGVGI